MAQLEEPFLLCHKLRIEDDRIVDYRLRQKDPKRCSVKAFKSLSLNIIAAGGPSMMFPCWRRLMRAFFQAPDNVREQFSAVSAGVKL